MTSATKSPVTELKRNAGLYKEVQNATDLRIAYKTGAGWKHLRVPSSVAEALRQTAIKVISVTAVTNEALVELVNEFSDC